MSVAIDNGPDESLVGGDEAVFGVGAGLFESVDDVLAVVEVVFEECEGVGGAVGEVVEGGVGDVGECWKDAGEDGGAVDAVGGLGVVAGDGCECVEEESAW